MNMFRQAQHDRVFRDALLLNNFQLGDFHFYDSLAFVNL
jgi:hypothetical protein